MFHAEQTVEEGAVTSPNESVPAGFRVAESWPVLVLAAGIGIHLLFLISLKTGWLNPLFNDSMHRFGPGCDFFAVYSAGIRARGGQPIYAFGDNVNEIPYAYAFRYAPVVAYTIGLLLSFLPYLTAYGLWLVICEWALLRNIRLTLENAPDRRTGYLAAFLWLTFSPYFLELYVGQFTFLTASMVFWAYIGWRKPPAGESKAQSVWSGLAFGSAVWLKMMPLLYLPIVILRGRWKAALASILVLAATSAVYFLHNPSEWPVFLERNTSATPTWHAGNQGLMALLYGVAHEKVPAFLQMRMWSLAIVGAALIWVAFAAWRVKEPNKETALVYLYAACSAAYLLLYKDVWEHHYVLLLPPLALLVLQKERPGVWLVPFLVAAVPTLFVLYDIPNLGFNEDPQRYWVNSASLLHHGFKPLAPLWLMAAVTIRITLLMFAKDQADKRPLVTRRVGWAVAALVGIAVIVQSGRFAQAAISAQRQTSRQVFWPSPVFEKQRTPQTCGPAALAAVCRYYGIAASETDIAMQAGTTTKGTTMLGLQQAAKEMGLVAEGWSDPMQDVAKLPRPCILFYDEGHYSVLTGMMGDRVCLADPSIGNVLWTPYELRKHWSGSVLVVGPKH